MSVAEIGARRAEPQAPASPPASLWEAFAAAQVSFGALVKDKDGQRGKYAPLDSVLDVVRPVLNTHGIALTQPTAIEGDTLVVRTLLVHKATGEMHECVYPAGLLSLQHQQLGAGVTYARRYSLLSILGVFPENEDDDGEKASTAGGNGPTRVRNEATGRMVNPNSAHQQRKNGSWERFEEKVRSFGDLDALEQWWGSIATKRAIEEWPQDWQKRAAEEYEKKQEALYHALASQRADEGFSG